MPDSKPGPRPYDLLEHTVLSAWLDEANVGLCVLDDTSRVVMINPTASKMLDVDAVSVLYQPFRAVLHNIDGRPSLIHWLSTSGFDGERRVVRSSAQGRIHLLLRSQTVSSAPGDKYKVIAITDISQMVAAQEEAEQYRRQWQAVNAGVVISDARLPDMPITYVNPMFERMSGFSSAEIVGQNCRFLQGSDRSQPGLMALRNAIREGINGYAILRNYRKDGSMFYNELFISPLRDTQGVITHFVGIQHLRTASDGLKV